MVRAKTRSLEAKERVFVLVAFVYFHFVPVGCLLELGVNLWVVGGSRCSVCFVGLCRFVRVPFSACRVSRFVAIGLLVYFLLFFHNVQLVCRLLVVVFSPSWLSSPLSSCTFGSDSVRECTSSFFFLFVFRGPSTTGPWLRVYPVLSFLHQHPVRVCGAPLHESLVKPCLCTFPVRVRIEKYVHVHVQACTA